MSPSPEERGRQAAELLVGSIERLKQGFAARGSTDLESQVRAGEAAVAAMKQLLSGGTGQLQRPDSA